LRKSNKKSSKKSNKKSSKKSYSTKGQLDLQLSFCTYFYIKRNRVSLGYL